MQNKQTALQIAIESYQNDGVSFTDWFMNNLSMLLAMEKEQIMMAYNKGFSSGIADYIDTEWGRESEVLDDKQYYQETYGK